MIAFALALLLVILAASQLPAGTAAGAAPAGCEDALETIQAEDATTRLVSGEHLEDVCVEGNLDLRSLDRIGDLSITTSFVDGDLLADGLHVSGITNLRDTQIAGAFSLDQAVLDDDLLLQDAVLVSGLSADGAQFRGLVFLDATIFASDLDFSNAIFLGAVLGRGSAFDGTLDFYRARFESRVSFRTAIIASADFELAWFSGIADFQGVTIQAPGGGSSAALALGNTNVAGELVLREAAFWGELHLDGLVAQSLDLTDADIASPSEIRLNQTSLEALSMDLDDVDRISLGQTTSESAFVGRRDDRLDALKLIASTAESDGDLTTANRAQYRVYHIEVTRWPQPASLLGLLTLEKLFGYWLQPETPTYALLWLALALFVAHLAAQLLFAPRPEDAPPRPQQSLLDTFGRSPDLVAASTFTWVQVTHLPWKKRGEMDMPARHWARTGLSVLVFVTSALATLLLAAALIGVIQAIPAGKEILDAF